MTPGLVSTIVPVFNRPAQLHEAVSSVLAQDWRPIEVIIVDDGSTDDGATLAAAKALAAAHPGIVRVATQANGGPGVAREHGRQLVQGEFIQYLDSDDILLPGKFSAQVAALRARPDADVAYGKTRYRHADGRIEPGAWKGSGTERATMFPTFLNERWWDTPNPLYRAEICDRAGPWTSLRLEEDWEYDCRIAALGARLVWCDQFVCEVRDHAGERLCRGTAQDQIRLLARARSHGLIWQHAREANLPTVAPDEVALFARSLFLLCRQCGAAGLPDAARHLFGLAQNAAGEAGARSGQMRMYAALAAVLGWQRAGTLGVWLDKVRSANR